ncbi:hypothetical protein CPB83DRAFT_863919 [Crepidotus variabilis]|uniref:F-box domain-containing protein n=1 Tax=Crepidotus variabilis TaxID=179855 RepID=A0A9P6JJ29_9AGAR|nr:hypothetical protein CPB83DRAFT_863919 [Crepidotus variabilis]
MPSLGFPCLQSVSALQSLLSSIHLRSPISPIQTSIATNECSAAIHQLPTDLLVRIFTYALDYSPSAPQAAVDPFVSPTFTWNHLETPFSLSHVCHRWMETVNSTKQLWHSISIYRPDSRHIYRTALWMMRADTHPIRVALTQSLSPSAVEEEATAKLLEILAHRILTWKAFEIKVTGPSLPKPLLKCFTDLQDAMVMDENKSLPQPILSNVAVTLDFNYRPPKHWRTIVDNNSPILPTYNLFNLIQTLPSLKFLHWNGRFTPGPSFSHTLETLELHSPISVEEFMERIPSCQQLQQLYVHHLTKPNAVIFTPDLMETDTDMDVDFAPTPRKPLPKLRRLGIASRMQISPILRGLSTPKLLVLELESRETIEPVDVHNFLQESGCSLQAFGLWPRQLNADDVAKWLKMKELQSVAGFKMLGVEVNDRILKMMNRPCLEDEPEFDDDSNPRTSLIGHTLFPELKELILGSCNTNIDVGILQRMLGSRFWTVPDVTRTTGEQMEFPPIPKTELRRAEVVVRDLTVDLIKYADMINTNGKYMRDKLINCVIRST